MPAYVISEAALRDEELAARYGELAARSIEQYGGRFLARDARPTAAEGTWPPRRTTTVIEFPTMERLREWYDSPEYAQARVLRTDALERRLLFVDGL